jgi:hypothetical protein
MILAVILYETAFSQVEDNFSDGDFLANPAWTGDTSRFEINSSGQLHLNSSGADTSILVTMNYLLQNTEWDLWIKLSFNTSTNNYARIYLVSDVKDISSSLNGYYLKIGGSDDSLWLIRQTGSTTHELIKGKYTSLGNSVNILRIKVIHDQAGLWHVFTDPLGGTDFREEGSGLDNSITTTSWFGIFCRYTTSNSAKFYFDDFYVGPVMTDTIPPEISSLKILDKNTICLHFTESVDKTFAENPDNYQTHKGEIPASAMVDSLKPGEVILRFLISFEEKFQDTLTVYNCTDIQGNTAGPLKAGFCYFLPGSFDILIDEIMADPDPSMGLPMCEYAELYNRSGFPVCLENWRFEWNTGKKDFPDITIPPGSYLILAKDTALNPFGTVLPLFTSSTTLSNEGSVLVLKNETGKIIHSVAYSKDWIKDPVKAEGGWSLEMIDPLNPCGCSDNWAVCTHPMGGTPGKLNSVNASHPDTLNPHITRAFLDDENSSNVVFSEPMDSLSLTDRNSWLVLPDLGIPDSLFPEPPEFSAIRLHFAMSFQKGTAYGLSFRQGPRDCAGNPADTLKIARLAIPDSTVTSDIVINEILFNPFSGGKRFVELFNLSSKVLDLNDLAVSSFDSATNSVSDKKALTDEDFLFFPGDYLVLTEDPEDIRSRYFSPDPDAFLTMPELPSMNDNSGIFVLLRKYDDRIIDKMNYSESMQFALLADPEGVSLERVNPLGSSGDKMNWHSAAESIGFATPGYRNSQYFESQPEESFITVPTPVFSPDNDGRDDILNILYHADSPGYLANIFIFDASGKLIRTLTRNRLVSSEDSFSWDGTDDKQRKAPIGIYILNAEIFQTGGKTHHIKKAVVLAGKF